MKCDSRHPRRSQAHSAFTRVILFIFALSLLCVLPSCKRIGRLMTGEPTDQTETGSAPASAQNAPAAGDPAPDDRQNDAPVPAAGNESALPQTDGAALPKLERARELAILEKLENAGLLRAGLSFIVETPETLEAAPEHGIGQKMTCYTYLIGENGDDHFVTLERVYFCPTADRLYRYDVVGDRYEEIVDK